MSFYATFGRWFIESLPMHRIAPEVLYMGNGKRGVTIGTYILVLLCFVAFTYGASIATTTVAQLIPVERNATIVIDPGHGGIDGGATSCSGQLESQYNLEISLKLEDLFHLLGFRTKMIRRTDISVYTSGETIAAKKVSDLRQRVRLVNETENAVLLSIHQNTFPDGKYHGAQVFYGPKGESRELANLLQEAFCETVNPGSGRQSKKAEGIYLLQHINCTGVLVECGFLSNPEEESKLRTGEYQNKICCILASVTGQFLTK